MRKIYLIIIFAVITANLYSQDFSKVSTSNIQETELKGVSTSTGLLFLDLQNTNTRNSQSTTASIKEQYGIKNLEELDYVNAFVIASSTDGFEEKYGFILSSSSNDIHTGLIPINKIQEMSLDEAVSYIDIGSKAETRLDKAFVSSNVTTVHDALGGIRTARTGKGVIVGIIDTGFDYTHPTFYDETKSRNRILRVWEQSNNSGTRPKGFIYGSEFSGDQIIAKKNDTPKESHGSHVAGIAAGSGSGSKDLLYKGVAYESDIILVSTSMMSTDIADAVKYIFEHAKSENKACVINISIGGHIGPHDGTSVFDRFVDNNTGDGKIIVGAAGNEGADKLFVQKKFSDTDTKLATQARFYTNMNNTKGQTYVDIWGEENKEYKTRVVIYNTKTKEIEDSTKFISSKGGTAKHSFGEVATGKCHVDIFSNINKLNNKPNTRIKIDNIAQSDRNRIATIEIEAIDTEIKMWSNSSSFSDNGYEYPYVDGSTESTVGEIGGTSKSIISVGAYTTKNRFKNFNGKTFTSPYFVGLEKIAPFSSMGPTADNRTKPDITAPGNVVASSVNSFDKSFTNKTRYTVDMTTDGTSEWRYAVMQGTSMASPMVAGIIALWLEEYPQLNPQQALEVLKTSSKEDEHTGKIPAEGSNTWGWGKIDATAGLLKIYRLPNNIMENKLLDNNVIIYPNPTQAELNIKSIQNIVDIEITNVEGQSITTIKNINTDNFSLNLENINNGIYFIKIKLENSVVYKKFIKNK